VAIRSNVIAASLYSWKELRIFSSTSSLRARRGSQVLQPQNTSGCPPHSLGLSCVGMRPLLPTTGHGSARPATEALGPSAADASGRSSVKTTSLRSSISATTAAPPHGQKQESRERPGPKEPGAEAPQPSQHQRRWGGSVGTLAAAPAGIDVGAGDGAGGLEVATTSTASPSTMAAPTGGSTWEACPMAARASWAPR
jgi:hypothetical protein